MKKSLQTQLELELKFKSYFIISGTEIIEQNRQIESGNERLGGDDEHPGTVRPGPDRPEH